MAITGRFAEHMAAPKNDVRANKLLHHVQDLRLHREVEERLTALDALVVLAIVSPDNMGTHQFFRAHTGVVANELIQRGSQMVNLRGWQAKARNQVSLRVILGNFRGVKCGHGIDVGCAR